MMINSIELPASTVEQRQNRESVRDAETSTARASRIREARIQARVDDLRRLFEPRI